ncbi:hypothetical protein IID20_03390 [Patescibacteria group bacterium]|nr:hypothetical protein [Patescibacteria group bacterium]
MNLKDILKIIVILVGVALMLWYAIFDLNIPETLQDPAASKEIETKGKGRLFSISVETKTLRVTDNVGINRILVDVDGSGQAVWKDINEIMNAPSMEKYDTFGKIIAIFLSTVLILYLFKNKKPTINN